MIDVGRKAHRKLEHLWDYCLHYFDGLFGENPDASEKWRWIETWIDSVPPGSRPGVGPIPFVEAHRQLGEMGAVTGLAPDNFRLLT